jgi:RHS repeat-associated protein
MRWNGRTAAPMSVLSSLALKGARCGYTGPDGTVAFSYDNTNQLTGASGARSESYSYDANGNRTMTGYSTGTGNRLSSDGTYNYTYDNEGNLATKTTIADNAQTTYAWDYRNRLTQVVVKNGAGQTLTTDVFTYDVEDRRIGKSVNGTQTWTSYDGPNAWGDYNSGGSLTMRYLNGQAIDQVFARYDGTTVAWYLRDNINSVREIVKADGTVLDQVTYDSFGNITNETTPANGDRFKFTGREWDSEIGQYYYRAREYRPDIGKFESEDPVAFSAGDPNLYRYVFNEPNRSGDPTGLAPPGVDLKKKHNPFRWGYGIIGFGVNDDPKVKLPGVSVAVQWQWPENPHGVFTTVSVFAAVLPGPTTNWDPTSGGRRGATWAYHIPDALPGQGNVYVFEYTLNLDVNVTWTGPAGVLSNAWGTITDGTGATVLLYSDRTLGRRSRDVTVRLTVTAGNTNGFAIFTPVIFLDSIGQRATVRGGINVVSLQRIWPTRGPIVTL